MSAASEVETPVRLMKVFDMLLRYCATHVQRRRTNRNKKPCKKQCESQSEAALPLMRAKDCLMPRASCLMPHAPTPSCE